MTPPSLRVRVLGYPPVTFGLLAGCGYIFWQWWGGQIPLLFVPLTCLAVVKTVKAYDEKREFEDWQRQEEDASHVHAPRLISLGGMLRIVLALAAVYCTTVSLGRFPEESVGASALRGVRWVALIYLAVALVRLVMAWYRRPRRPEAVVPAEPVYVSWMLEVPTSSPSRMDAVRELPEYCVRLLQG